MGGEGIIMPKYRQIHTKIIDSFDFNEMPDDFTRLVWVLLPLILDSEGRGIANAAWIRSRMFPLRNDVSDEQLRSAFVWFLEHKMVIEYQVGERSYFYVPSFKKYQVHTERESPSNLPDPLTPELVQTYSGVTPELLRTNSIAYESASVYESASESVLTQEIKTTIYTTKDAEKAYRKVTGLASLPSSVYPRLDNILDLLQHYGWDETINRLTQALTNWRNQKNKTNGASYKITNPTWIDFAITGETIGAPPELSRVERNLQEIERMTREAQQ
jgi:hypothetical protein